MLFLYVQVLGQPGEQLVVDNQDSHPALYLCKKPQFLTHLNHKVSLYRRENEIFVVNYEHFLLPQKVINPKKNCLLITASD